MPVHFHPVIRSLEEAEESAGLIVAIDSAGVVAKKAAETVNTPPATVLPKVVPVGYTRIINGQRYDAH